MVSFIRATSPMPAVAGLAIWAVWHITGINTWFAQGVMLDVGSAMDIIGSMKIMCGVKELASVVCR